MTQITSLEAFMIIAVPVVLVVMSYQLGYLVGKGKRK